MSKRQPTDGLLAEHERDHLTDPATASETRNEFRETVRERLRPTLGDLQVLYLTLRDADLEAAFCPDDEHERASVRSAIQYAVGLFALGAFRNGDLIETRIRDALKYAGFANRETVTARVELQRNPLPSFERSIARFEAEGLSEETMCLWEQHLWNSEIEAERVAIAGEHLGMDTSVAEIRETRAETAAFERPPQSVITNVSVEQVDAENRP